MVNKEKQLLDMMKNMDKDKAEGWGLKKVDADVEGEQIMEAYQHNFNKALKKLEL